MQSREMGQKKSSEFKWLFRHLTIQWLFFAFGLVYFVGPVLALAFATLNAVVHGIIDWYIWKGYKLTAHIRINKEVDKLAAALIAGGVPMDAETHKAAYDAGVQDWKYWEDHVFYSTIGFDQLLHILTIIGLFALLML